ncbi:type II toxin-antitoxin system RelE/ParE family toxin [Aerophototrophica crusticola]|uniref:Type II toxin-antitoxin system RelE/ParE family toxin n=1 Tax=Aerophototrophica crusticola TaxID=1709002 RepID=A0A858RBB4_9PROT|nr:type II toxin-antitoxin system RelE/ParE family toxin [Rhodospirillaceae bacterium B3]
MRVAFTPTAERHLDNLHRYIATRSGEAIADGYVGRIIGFCQSLATFPDRGIRRDDIVPGLRVVGFERRVSISFTLEGDLVLVQGVFYGGRQVRA